jgi:hypothetical protein
VVGTNDELLQASNEYWNHAQALTLLGTYLVDFCGADVRRRIEIQKLLVEESQYGAKARRVIAAYERMFAGRPEADILRALGYFDRPAAPAALRLVLPEIEDRRYRAALKRLYNARLILTSDSAQPLDCHPLVREHFSASATGGNHARLYHYYTGKAPHQPETLEEMTPLFLAVYHGCQAGLHQTALDEVYRERIYRGNDAYVLFRLGAFGTSVSLLASFFQVPWTRPVAALSQYDRAWLMCEAGFVLRAVGRLADAVEPMQAGAEALVDLENWKNAASDYNNLSEVHLTLGNISDAVAAARRSIDLAELSRSLSRRIISRGTLANALHQSGALSRAATLLQEAEQRARPRKRPTSTWWGV